MDQSTLLKHLQATFPAGATSGSLDVSGLSNAAYTTLFTRLGLSTTMTLSSSQGWQLSGNDVTLSGAINSDFFGLSSPAVLIQFSPDPDQTDAFVLLIDLTLPSTWTLGQSIARLAGGVFDELVLDTSVAPALIVSSGSASDPLRTVEGGLVAVTQGLWFYGLWSTTAGPAPYTLAIALLSEFAAQSTVFGQIGLDLSPGASDPLSMDLLVASGTVEQLFGSQSTTSLEIDLSLQASLDPGSKLVVTGIALSTTIDFGETVTLTALLSSSNEGLLVLGLSGTALAIPEPSVLEQFFGADNGILSNLPGQFQGQGLDLVQIGGINFGINLNSKSLAFAILEIDALPDQIWPVWQSNSETIIGIGELTFTFSIFDPFGDQPAARFDFTGVFELASVLPILIRAQFGTDVDLILSGSLVPGEEPKLADLVSAMFPGQTAVPDELILAELDFSADITAEQYELEVDIEGDWSFDFGEQNQVVFEELRLRLSYDGQAEPNIEADIEGKFAVGQNQFDISVTVTDQAFSFVGSWTDTGAPLTYIDIVMALGMYGLPALPDGVDLDLVGAKLTFDSQAPTFTFELDSKSFGDALIVAGKASDGSWGFVFGLIGALDLKLDLTNIDVIGPLVPADAGTLEIKDLRFVGATATLPDITLDAEQQKIVGPSLASGITLSLDVAIGTLLSEQFNIRFAQNDGSSFDTPPATQAQPRALVATPPATASAGPQINWVAVQRAFGPVQINRVGFTITADNSLGLLFDAAVSLAGLTITLDGLEADIPISKPFTPSFSLAGLEVAFASDGFSLAGGLAKVPGQTPAEFVGNLTLQVGSFGATVFGEYTTVDSQPSLFAFVAIDVPLGGPPVFFVTGLAGGFGYNSQLQLPTIDTVASFPLINAVANPPPDPKLIECSLEQLVTPTVNEFWAAAGIRFTSFEILDSFALLTVSFGNEFSVALLGESTLTLPVAVDGEPPPTVLAKAQMVLMVEYVPSQGFLAVAAQLSPSSFVLDPNAKLTGGFAFYSWFGPSPHAGDFVVSLGGYNPYFVPPDYYPTVPRLGIAWQIDSSMAITGGAYFAFTPSVVMAGGSLSATYSSGKIQAWFDVGADFLIRFAPFGYLITASIDVGVSVTLNLLVTTKKITVHVGVDLELWGPPFGGQARIDLAIISFTLSFGAGQQAPPPVPWSSFVSGFLPPPQSGASQPAAVLALADTDSTTTNSIIALNAAAGLLQTLADGSWQVDPDAFALLVNLQIPSKEASVDTGTSAAVPGSWSTQFGVGPSNVTPDQLDTSLTIQITAPQNENNDWTATAVIGAAPKGLWLSTDNQMSSDGLIDDVLVGVSLLPTPLAPATTASMPLSLLEVDGGDPVTLQWPTPMVPISDPFGDDDPMSTMQQTLTSNAATRAAYIAALEAQGLELPTVVDVTNFAQQAPTLLLSPPALRLVGEQAAQTA